MNTVSMVTLGLGSSVQLLREYGIVLMVVHLMLLLKPWKIMLQRKRRLNSYKRQPLWVNFIILILSSYMEWSLWLNQWVDIFLCKVCSNILHKFSSTGYDCLGNNLKWWLGKLSQHASSYVSLTIITIQFVFCYLQTRRVSSLDTTHSST